MVPVEGCGVLLDDRGELRVVLGQFDGGAGFEVVGARVGGWEGEGVELWEGCEGHRYWFFVLGRGRFVCRGVSW